MFSKLRKNVQSGCAVALMFAVSSVMLTGCTPSQKQTTVQVITQVNAQIPAIIAGADTVAATVAALMPADALLIGITSTAFDTGAKLVQSLTTAYLANPNADTLTQLQNAVTTLEANVNQATLGAARITNPASQAIALAAMKGLLTVVSVVFGLIQSTMTKAQVAAIAASGTIRFARMRRYMDEDQLAAMMPTGLSVDRAFAYEAAQGL